MHTYVHTCYETYNHLFIWCTNDHCTRCTGVFFWEGPISSPQAEQKWLKTSSTKITWLLQFQTVSLLEERYLLRRDEGKDNQLLVLLMAPRIQWSPMCYYTSELHEKQWARDCQSLPGEGMKTLNIKAVGNSLCCCFFKKKKKKSKVETKKTVTDYTEQYALASLYILLVFTSSLLAGIHLCIGTAYICTCAYV